MPGVISVQDFIREVKDDFASPTTSNFVSRIPQCRETVNKLEEVGLQKKYQKSQMQYREGEFQKKKKRNS